MSLKAKAIPLSVSHPDLQAIADAIPHGTGSDLSTHQLLILCHLPAKQRSLKATDVFTPWNCLRMGYATLKFVEDDALKAAHLPRNKIPPTTQERSGWNRVPKHAKKVKTDDGNAEMGPKPVEVRKTNVAFRASPPEVKQELVPRQMGQGPSHRCVIWRPASTPDFGPQVNSHANPGPTVQDSEILSYMNHIGSQALQSRGVYTPGPQAPATAPPYAPHQNLPSAGQTSTELAARKGNHGKEYGEGFTAGYEKGRKEGYEKGLKQGWEDALAQVEEEEAAIMASCSDDEDYLDDDDDDGVEDMDESGDYEP